jgi:hypothetical protein
LGHRNIPNSGALSGGCSPYREAHPFRPALPRFTDPTVRGFYKACAAAVFHRPALGFNFALPTIQRRNGAAFNDAITSILRDADAPPDAHDVDLSTPNPLPDG